MSCFVDILKRKSGLEEGVEGRWGGGNRRRGQKGKNSEDIKPINSTQDEKRFTNK